MQREFAEVLAAGGFSRRHAAAAARRPRAARPAPGRAPDPGQLPHRHADGVHDGADALGAAPGGLPGRPRRRRLPAARRRRRRRRAGPRPDDRRTRHPFRGPAIAARRHRRGHREAGDHLHRRQRAHRPAAPAGGAAGRTARRPRHDDQPQPVRERVVVEHPLQPFDIRNVTPGELVPGQAVHLRPDRAGGGRGGRRRPQQHPRRSSRGPLPAPPADDVVLADLLGFFKDPVKGFFRALDFTLPWDVDGVAGRHAGRDRHPRGVDGRRPDAGRHAARHAAGHGAPDAEWRRGTLPPGQLGWRKATEIRDQAADLATAALQIPHGRPHARTTSTSTSAAGAGSPARCRRCSATAWCR